MVGVGHDSAAAGSEAHGPDHRAVPPARAPGTVWRVRTRQEFALLRRGRSVRRGPVAVRFRPGSDGSTTDPPRVAYAIGRSFGPAVVRNRMRRRLRHLVADLARENRIPQGLSLIMVQPEAIECSAEDLLAALDDAFGTFREPPPSSPRGTR